MSDRHAAKANHLGTATIDGHGRLQVGDTIIHNYNGSQRNCLADLLLVDSRDEKTRIEDTKGGLIKESYQWILDHDEFRQWRDDRKSRLLWIKGDAGKGKTMLLCGIIDELSKSQAQPLSFFLCQGTARNLDNATAVL
ncbi:vegetative incompatibility protein HET-E-1 [Colletotrichum spaethianum]|uniref:Vegetative incompatibility protein HET-E-1 n=1 Tax=Colletotrichum spaethianum TaxID=700344 RepID=A0AA37NY85_9PEZI|nr:vegetative incompatibility protein HET-E-1 [Colletotrichum spaethianum]GKT45967.1 vegetative incompatibility protein HET-E-1 [Colletotrichum spaethianum]